MCRLRGVFLVFALANAAWAIRLGGKVVDGLERPVAGADVQLSDTSGIAIAQTRSAADGMYAIDVAPGRYLLHVSKQGFANRTLPLDLTQRPVQRLTIALAIATMQQSVIVAANGTPTPEAQLGQSVSSISRTELQQIDAVTLDQALRLEPGLAVTRTGQWGGLTELYARGGEPAFTKILIDNVPVQRTDFGAFDFSTLLAGDIAETQIVRGPDSVIYGSDALSGVIDIHTLRGSDELAPQVQIDTNAGRFDFLESSDRLAGNWQKTDYAFSFGHAETHNQQPNDKYRNNTYAGNIGIHLRASTIIRVTSRYTRSGVGVPGAVPFFAMAADSLQRQAETYSAIDLSNHTSAAWHNRISLTESSINYFFENPSPTGIPYNPFGLGTNYIGGPVTIIGANGYSTTGQAILDFDGVYPVLFASDSLRRDVDWASDYQLTPTWKVVGGYRYYNARGLTAGEDLSRHDNGVYAQINGGAWNRAFGSVGLSSDRNSVFGSTTNPQASVAVFPSLRRGRWIDETRLRSSGGTALRDPDISQQQFSLYEELINAGAQSSIATLGVRPIHPQRGRSFDVGLDQYLVADRVRFSATVFDNHYYDLIEFVPDTAFPLLGIPPQAATLTLGAYLNSLTEKARGTELELSARAGANWQFDVAYTHLNARVLKSFSADALSPSFNRAFPNIPIGAYSPLVGARPFRRAPETGSARIGYSRRGWGAEANADFSSRRDDSTFLVDANFGTSMLLPNHDLAPAYADVNVAGFLRISPRITLHGAVDNVLNDRYQEVFGYPALGINARAGIRLSLSPAR